jgi:hypothetical protein
MVGKNELAFPAQRRTEVWMICVKAVEFAFHAAPPAFKMARLSDTLASCTL